MKAGLCPVVELRSYVLHPGQRETLIDVFDRELLESQEELGMEVLGQFREMDDADRFTWLRGFTDMESRRAALTAFYSGPVWAAHAPVANPTMAAFDDVLLLRALAPETDVDVPRYREPVGSAMEHPAVYTVTTYPLVAPLDPVTRRSLAQPASGDRTSVAVLETEPAENTYPALPVREGEHVVVHLRRYDDARAHLATAGDSPFEGLLMSRLLAPPTERRLSPTCRSRLT